MTRLAAVLVMALATSAAAQEREPARPPREEREQAFRMVDAYIASRLQESLGLSEEQRAKVLPLVTQLHRDRRDFVHRRIQVVREMRRLLASGTATEAEVDQRLAEAKRLERDEPTKLRQDREAVDAALTPLQQAKLRVLEAEVEQKIRALRHRGEDRPGPRRPGPDEESRPQS